MSFIDEPMTENEILRTIDDLYTHLSLNMLSLQPKETLIPFLLVTDEASHRADILERITDDMLGILQKMAQRDIKALELTWFKEKQQFILKEAFRRNLIKGEKIYGRVNYVWDELKDALEENLLYPTWYTPPPLRIHLEMTPEQNAARNRTTKGLGEHHLGNLYPLNDQFKEWRLNATQKERDGLFQEEMAYRGEVASRTRLSNKLQNQAGREKTYGHGDSDKDQEVLADTGEANAQANHHQDQPTPTGHDTDQSAPTGLDTDQPARAGIKEAGVGAKKQRKGLPPQSVHKIYPQPLSADGGAKNERCEVKAIIRFPNLRIVIGQLIDQLCDVKSPKSDLRHIPYRRILMSESRQDIIESLYSFIDRDIKSLQNITITVKQLQRIADNQSRSTKIKNDWLPNSGYADIVLDRRVEEYWRAYIGQPSNPLIRFIDHIKGAMSLVPKTLHYFTLWKGDGYRSINFLRLWTLPGPDSESYNEEKIHIFSNILEMVFARAFQSLPLESLQEFFPDLKEPYEGLGLNVLSPLYQGFTADQSVRYQFTLRVGSSYDPEIREWPQFRAQTRTPATSAKRFKWGEFATNKVDYLPIFMNKFHERVGGAVGMQVPLSAPDSEASGTFDVREWCKKLKDKLQRDITEPIGSVDARMGIMLNEPLLSAEGSGDVLPFGFEESGFNETNSLIWFYDPRRQFLGQRFELSHIASTLASYQSQMIMSSNLQVILLDLDLGIDWYKPYHPRDHEMISFDIPLYCGMLKFFVEVATADHKIQRIFIQSPFQLSTLWTNKGRAVLTLVEMFRFLEILTNSQGLRPFYTSNRSAISTILRIYHAEINGAPKMTVDDMHPTLEAYLHRRGFRTKEDISRLEKIGGTLMRGVWMVMYTINRARNRERKAPSSDEHSVQKQGVFGQDQLSSAQKLYAEVTGALGYTGQIPTSSKSEEAEAEVEDQTVEESSTDDDECEDSEKDKKRAKTQIVPATEDELEGATAAMDHEIFGTADSQEMAQIEDLVAEKYVAEPGEEELDILCGDSLDQIVMDDDGQDLEESLEFDTSEHGILCSINEEALPLRKYKVRDQSREEARSLLQSGKYYPGAWKQQKNALEIRVCPNIASIVLHLPGYKREYFPKQVLVKAHIHPGRCHPQRWAIRCHDDEPAAKLAFSITTEEGSYFTRNSGTKAALKANTFMDWVSGDPVETLLLRPRRHINAHGPEYVKALGLSAKGTWFTDEKAKLQWGGLKSKQPDSKSKLVK